MSDSLLMEGVKIGCANVGELALKAINAGVDILLDVADPVGTLDSLEKAVAAGEKCPEGSRPMHKNYEPRCVEKMCEAVRKAVPL